MFDNELASGKKIQGVRTDSSRAAHMADEYVSWITELIQEAT